ncbi:uncharacterized protein PAC_00209 [Phialocephala subalpina]|uniref:Uncharacterized protein n=1 Tax=Phialocephala subalpina TaxID=576137 RepID=A0A1L7WC35_9HELO|nr:uncharacterized protein PAC_00209 [Phialocephala subalpina]
MKRVGKFSPVLGQGRVVSSLRVGDHLVTSRLLSNSFVYFLALTRLRPGASLLGLKLHDFTRHRVRNR